VCTGGTAADAELASGAELAAARCSGDTRSAGADVAAGLALLASGRDAGASLADACMGAAGGDSILGSWAGCSSGKQRTMLAAAKRSATAAKQSAIPKAMQWGSRRLATALAAADSGCRYAPVKKASIAAAAVSTNPAHAPRQHSEQLKLEHVMKTPCVLNVKVSRNICHVLQAGMVTWSQV